MEESEGWQYKSIPSSSMKKAKHKTSERVRYQRLSASIVSLGEVVGGLEHDRKVPLDSKVDVVTEAKLAVERLRSEVERLHAKKQEVMCGPTSFTTEPSTIRAKSSFSVGDMSLCFRVDPIARLIMNLDGSFLTWNDAFLKLTGASPEKLSQLSNWSVSLRSDIPGMVQGVARLLNGEVVTFSRAQCMVFCGRKIDLYITCGLMKDRAGGRRGIQASFIPFPDDCKTVLQLSPMLGPVSRELINRRDGFVNSL